METVMIGRSHGIHAEPITFGFAMAEYVTRMVDLKRLALIERLGLPLPDNMAAEKQLWSELSVFLKTGHPINPSPPIVGGQNE